MFGPSVPHFIQTSLEVYPGKEEECGIVASSFVNSGFYAGNFIGPFVSGYLTDYLNF